MHPCQVNVPHNFGHALFKFPNMQATTEGPEGGKMHGSQDLPGKMEFGSLGLKQKNVTGIWASKLGNEIWVKTGLGNGIYSPPFHLNYSGILI